MKTKRLLNEFKAMQHDVDANNGLSTRDIVGRRILVAIAKVLDLQRQYELINANNPDANCKKFTDDELDDLKEVKKINRSIGKRLGAIKKATKKT